MEITVLIDNCPCPYFPALMSEHGLSLFIEYSGKRILCDMGASRKFHANADILGKDLNTVDFAFVSHAHVDHTGGLRHFLETVPDKRVYISSRAFSSRYYSYSHARRHSLSPDYSILDEFTGRFSFVDDSMWISPDIAVVTCRDNSCLRPYANSLLFAENDGTEHPDDFSHELSLAFRSPDGLVIVSSCSHCGAVNIMQSCCRFTGESHVHAFIGGLHLVDNARSSDELAVFSDEINRFFPDVRIITGHCTGSSARSQLPLSVHFAEFFHTGSVFSL